MATTYTITFDANGGTGAPAPMTKTHDVPLVITTATPTRAHYTFYCWNTRSDGNGRDVEPGGTIVGNSSKTLYAIWAPESYTVTYNTLGGTPVPRADTKLYGVNLTLNYDDIKKPGYWFNGWSETNGGEQDYPGGGTYKKNQSIVLYAVWKENPTRTLTYMGGDGITDVPAAQSALSGQTITLSSTKPKMSSATRQLRMRYHVDDDVVIDRTQEYVTETTTFIFDHWDTSSEGDGDWYYPKDKVVLKKNMTLYPIFTFKADAVVNLPTPTRDQYTFLGWSRSEENVKILTSPYHPTGNRNFYAIWTGNGNGGYLRFTLDSPDASFPTDELAVGNKVRLVGLPDNNDGVYTIASVRHTANTDTTKTDVTMEFEEDFQTSGSMDTENFELEIWSDGNYVPPMDYICESNNRLWGCSSKRRTIYASALGEPDNFWTFAGSTLDSYQVAVATAGDFTGCIALNSQILFFKQNVIHKMLGAYPAEYALYTYECDGVSKTNGMSLINVDNTAVYVANHGIGRYSGASAGLVSRELGEGNMRNAVAGYDGEKIYLRYEDTDGNPYTYVYDTRYGLWLQKDYGDAKDFATVDGITYVLAEKSGSTDVYRLNTGVPLEGDWEITFKPFYETKGNYGALFEKKRYIGIAMRLELPLGSWIKAQLKTDNSKFHTVAMSSGRRSLNHESVQEFHIATPRCDKMQLKLTGHGECTILAMERIYIVGSRR